MCFFFKISINATRIDVNVNFCLLRGHQKSVSFCQGIDYSVAIYINRTKTNFTYNVERNIRGRVDNWIGISRYSHRKRERDRE